MPHPTPRFSPQTSSPPRLASPSRRLPHFPSFRRRQESIRRASATDGGRPVSKYPPSPLLPRPRHSRVGGNPAPFGGAQAPNSPSPYKGRGRREHGGRGYCGRRRNAPRHSCEAGIQSAPKRHRQGAAPSPRPHCAIRRRSVGLRLPRFAEPASIPRAEVALAAPSRQFCSAPRESSGMRGGVVRPLVGSPGNRATSAKASHLNAARGFLCRV